MSSKRPRQNDTIHPPQSKKRSAFDVGPSNLPDGTWRRKVLKIKHDLVHKAKVKKEYAKLKAREQAVAPTTTPTARTAVINNNDSDDDVPTAASSSGDGSDARVDTQAATSQELHPSRQAMLDAPEPSSTTTQTAPKELSQTERAQRNRERRRNERKEKDARKPAYFGKELALAEQRRSEAEGRRDENKRRERERASKLQERERMRRAMAKARVGGRNGQRKLGRESTILLERVRKLVGS